MKFNHYPHVDIPIIGIYCMDRRLFSRLWSATTWIILLTSFVYDYQIYGIDPFFIVIGMWIFGGFVTNAIFGKQQPQQENNQSPMYPQNKDQQSKHEITREQDPIDPIQRKPSCPGCGSLGYEGDMFCQYCGTTLEKPVKN